MSVLTPPAPPSRSRTARSALGLLRKRSWWLALLGVVFLSVVFVLLGRWQYGRYETRSAGDALVRNNYDAAPAPLTAVMPDLRRPLPHAREYRPVRVAGTYDTAHTVLLRNRPQDGSNGYDVVVPLRTTEGPVLYVDRGWIPAGTRSAAEPDTVPAAPAGPVTVVARLRASEPASNRPAPAGQANRLAVDELGRALDPALRSRVVEAYGALVGETPPAAGTPSPYERPDAGLYGINLAYAFQWWVFGAFAVYIWVRWCRDVLELDEESPEESDVPEQVPSSA